MGYMASGIYFSNFLENKEEKEWSDPQPDSTIQPKARGQLHMEHDYFGHHIWSRYRGMSTLQPRNNQEFIVIKDSIICDDFKYLSWKS